MAAWLTTVTRKQCNNHHHLLTLAKTLEYSSHRHPYMLERLQGIKHFSKRERHAFSSNSRKNLLLDLQSATIQPSKGDPVRQSLSSVASQGCISRHVTYGSFYGFVCMNRANVDYPFAREVVNPAAEEGPQSIANARFAVSEISEISNKKLEFKRFLRYQTQQYGGKYHCLLLEAVDDKSNAAMYHAVVREASPMKPKELSCWSFMNDIPVSGSELESNGKNKHPSLTKQVDTSGSVAKPIKKRKVKKEDDSLKSGLLIANLWSMLPALVMLDNQAAFPAVCLVLWNVIMAIWILNKCYMQNDQG